MKLGDEKSQKREVGLMNPSIIKRTEKIFPDETKLILASTNLMRRLTNVSKDASTKFSEQPNLQAVINLFARNRELVHFSVICLMNAGYAPIKVLSRAALENTLCMRLFNKKPELAKEWFSNPDEFRKEWKPQRIRDVLFPINSNLRKDYNVFYWRLCDYAHPSLKGWSELILERSILWHPVFNEDYASECIGLIFFIIVQSLKEFTKAFKEWFTPKMVAEVNNIGLKDSQMIRRHFQVSLVSTAFREQLSGIFLIC